MSSVCPHGIEFGEGGLGEGVAWAGGVSFCECCRSQYGYIDSCAMRISEDGKRSGWTRTSDKTLCYACGGQDTRQEYSDE